MFQWKRAILILNLILASSAIPTLLKAGDADAWRRWLVLLQQSCPEKHVDWKCDSCWSELTGAFEDTLGTSDQRKISRVRDFRVCEQEKIGILCEMGASLRAYLRAGSLQHFVAFGCRAVKCERTGTLQPFSGSRPITRVPLPGSSVSFSPIHRVT
jgi:hypothetical protein